MRDLIDIVVESQSDLVAAAIEHFGLTRDPRECGYIIPDGRMLDLSGRHWDEGSYVRDGDYWKPIGRDYQAGNRQVDHRDTGELIPEVLETATDYMLAFMDRTGSIRCMPERGFSIPHHHRPTPAQIATMMRCATVIDGGVVEVYDDHGDASHYMEFDRLLRADLQAFIDKAFPEGQ